jgi:uncharacterized protein with HEPN domain
MTEKKNRWSQLNSPIHDYFGVDLEAVWDTIKRNIPSYKRNIENILKNEVVVINDKPSKKP